MNRKELLKQIKKAVQNVEPEAEIILYGSRSRDDANKESDWDLLIKVDNPMTDERTDRIRHSLYNVEWDSGEVISSIIRTNDEWNSSLYQAMPFYQKVEQEGIKL